MRGRAVAARRNREHHSRQEENTVEGVAERQARPAREEGRRQEEAGAGQGCPAGSEEAAPGESPSPCQESRRQTRDFHRHQGARQGRPEDRRQDRQRKSAPAGTGEDRLRQGRAGQDDAAKPAAAKPGAEGRARGAGRRPSRPGAGAEPRQRARRLPSPPASCRASPGAAHRSISSPRCRHPCLRRPHDSPTGSRRLGRRPDR